MVSNVLEFLEEVDTFHLRQRSSLQKKSEQTITMKMVTMSEIFFPAQEQSTNYSNEDGHWVRDLPSLHRNSAQAMANEDGHRVTNLP